MKQYYQTAVRHQQQMPDGKMKNVTDSFLVDAVSFGEAEARTIDFCKDYGEFTVTRDASTNITDVIRSENSDINVFWKAKVYFITIDEKSGREKKSASIMLVEADSLSDVAPRITNYLSSCVVDYEIGGIQDTKIIDIIQHE